MDLLDHGLFDARSPYNYTFNFWNDYLGLSTIVSNNKLHPPALSANSITESLKATLGLDDSPVCSCVIGHGGGGGDGHADCCCCRCCCLSGAPSGSTPPPPPLSIFDLKERLALLRPYDRLLSSSPCAGDAPLPAEERDAAYRESFGAMDLHGLALDRRRNKQPHAHAHGGGSAGRSGKPEPKVCVFCRNNGAPEEVYGSHILKTADGRVLCPILRAYTCPLCSANGDHAHTIKYCPLSRDHPSQRATKGSRTVHKRLAIF